MKKELLKVSIRNQAIYIPREDIHSDFNPPNQAVFVLVANARKLGFTFSEPLLQALNGLSPVSLLEVLDLLKEVTGVKKNWTPLVKAWNIPTGERVRDHIATLFANLVGTPKGTVLPCRHSIPKNTFPLERYNGCPFCGRPFEFGALENYGQGSKLKVLELWTSKDIEEYYKKLLASKTALDATQMDSLKKLLNSFGLPESATIRIKETLMLVVDILIDKNQAKMASKLFNNPNDILRYLWYKHTGFLQIIEPKNIINRASKNNSHFNPRLDKRASTLLKAKAGLKLKYSRKECFRVATWLNALHLDVEKACEIMHPKRSMWVRFIRALRLAEYSKRKGFEKLSNLLDVFYNETYTVWQGRINYYRLRNDSAKTFSILKKRPGLFARSLFSNMLWFGAEETLHHFEEIQDKTPARLLLSLNMYAKYYFDKNASRLVKPLGGTNKRIPANQLLQLYDEKDLKGMQAQIEALCIVHMKHRFSKISNDNKTMFIADNLFRMPLAIGDRSETVQDMSSTLMGTRFPIEGNTIRLFMQWGEGLRAQQLDMDLSCMVAYDQTTDFCSYARLNIFGCKHSGDIRRIPNKVGTAEYIDININTLRKGGAKYVSFTCNAYTSGSITPGLVVGWMDSKYPMKISQKTGVAYDPSCVQQQIKVTQGLTKGLVFGVLDIENQEIIWLEMSFGGQIVQNLNTKNVETLLAKLDAKLSIGKLLELKAEAQELELVSNEELADEIYNSQWAMNAAAVSELLVD